MKEQIDRAGRAYLEGDYDLAIGILNDIAYNDINPKHRNLDHRSRLYRQWTRMFYNIRQHYSVGDDSGKKRAFIKRLMEGEQ